MFESIVGGFSDCMTGYSLRPSCVLDLTTCDFYLWCSLRDKVYKTNPNILEELRNICHNISATSTGRTPET
jgi:hypothetical protein